MPPLNRAERNNAFLGFLLLFLITIGIVITVIFFSIETSRRENEQLRSEVLTIQLEKNLSDSFRIAMSEAMNDLTRYDSKEELADVTRARVLQKIEKMRKVINSMPNEVSDEENSVYDLALQNLITLNYAKWINRKHEDQNN